MDTRLSVFRGSYDRLECVASNDDACGLQSIVHWQTVRDEIYYIVVHGVDEREGAFSFNTGGVENDVCEHAIGPLPVDAESRIEGSTMLASKDFGPNPITTFLISNDECRESFLQTNIGDGVWYHVDAEKNENLTASTCDSNTEFNTIVGIYTGSCGSLVCLRQQNDVCGFHARVSWDAIAGERYYILIYGPGNNLIRSRKIGDFVPRIGNTEDFEDEDTVLRRQWFNTQISVHTGSCRERVCTIGDDAGCGGFRKSVATWIAQEGVEYLIHIHGKKRDEGRQLFLFG
jgi:hypothetical protein